MNDFAQPFKSDRHVALANVFPMRHRSGRLTERELDRHNREFRPYWNQRGHQALPRLRFGLVLVVAVLLWWVTR